MSASIIVLGLIAIFAMWLLDIFNIDASKGNQFVIALIIGGIVVYWRMGRLMFQDDVQYVTGAVILMGIASIYKTSIEEN